MKIKYDKHNLIHKLLASSLEKYDLSTTLSIEAEQADGYIIFDRFNVNAINNSKFIILQDYKAAIIQLPFLYKNNIRKPTYILDLPTLVSEKSSLPKEFILVCTTIQDLPLYAQYKDYPLVFLGLNKSSIKQQHWSPKWRLTDDIKNIKSAMCYLSVKPSRYTPYDLKCFAGMGIPLHTTYYHSYLKQGINGIVSDSIASFSNYLKLRDSALYYESVCNSGFAKRLEEIVSGKAENINIKDNLITEQIQKKVYVSPDMIPRIKDSQYIHASTLVQAFEKLSSLSFSKAYIFNIKLKIGDQDRLKVKQLLKGMGEKVNNIFICIDTPVPYIEGLSILSKTEGLKQNIS